MGLPEILIEFKAKAESAVKRSQNGVLALIVLDTTKTVASYGYSTLADVVTADWSAETRKYLDLAFAGAPRRVLIERIASFTELDAALSRLKNKKWDWLAVPQIAKAITNVKTVCDWIIAQRAAKKGFKAVLPCTAASSNPNHEGIVDFATDEIKCGALSFTAAEFCVRIASLLAGLPLDESATYAVIPEVTSIKESLNPDSDINNGKFILVNDGEKVKVGRAVNSLHTLSGNKTEDMKKIKIIEGIDLIRSDIRSAFESNYVGVNNSMDNKMLFISAVNQYFSGLVRAGVLYDGAENKAEIDIDAQRAWLADRYDVSDYTDEQIKNAKTGSYLFAKANVTFADAIEDLNFTVSMG